MPDLLATIDDLAAVWRDVEDSETARATRLLEMASAAARARVQRIDERIADGTLDDVVVAMTVAGAVARTMRNPQGLKSFSVDDYSQENATDPADGVQFSAAELATLRGSVVVGQIHVRPAL